VLTTVQAEVGTDFFQDPALARIAVKALELHGQGYQVTPALLLNHLDGDAARELTVLSFKDADYRQVLVNRKQTVADCLKRIKELQIRRQIDRLTREQAETEQVGDEARVWALSQEIYSLNRLLKETR
jgi:hypothetical protein